MSVCVYKGVVIKSNWLTTAQLRVVLQISASTYLNNASYLLIIVPTNDILHQRDTPFT